MRRAALALVLVAGCQLDLSGVGGAFVAPGDHVRVHCAVNLDAEAQTSWASIDSGLDRAARRGEILDLYAHHPGVTVGLDTLEHVLAGARDRGLAFDTYDDVSRGTARYPGLLLSFDDTSVDAWVAARPLFQQYGARVTFFVSRFAHLSAEQRAGLHLLAGDGDAIEAHTVQHLRGPEYVAARGLDAYLADEVQPSIDVLVAEGFDVRAFAYPFGARTDETDRAILGRVAVVRSVAFTFEGESGPCPR